MATKKRNSFFDEYVPVKSGGETEYVKDRTKLEANIRKKEMNVKAYRSKPIVRKQTNGGDTEVYVSPRNIKPKMPKVLKKWDVQKQILKSPRKYSKVV